MMNFVTIGLIRSLNWAISNLSTLLTAWYPDGFAVDTAALTGDNLDRLRDVIHLVGYVIQYLQPFLPAMDVETLNFLIRALILLCNSIFRLWAANQNVLNAGNIDIGDYEAVEVYQNILFNAGRNLVELIANMQNMLN